MFQNGSTGTSARDVHMAYRSLYTNMPTSLSKVQKDNVLAYQASLLFFIW